MALIPYPSIVVVNSSSGSSNNIRRENIAPPFFLRIERYALTSPVSLRQTRRATPISRPTIGQWGYTNSRGGKHASWKKNDRDKDGIYSKFGWLRSGLFSFDEFSVEGEIRSKWENAIFSRSIFKRDYCYYDWAPASIPLGLKERRGEKCVETRRSIEAQLLRNTIHSITYVFIRQIGTKEQQARGNESLLPSRTGFEGYRVF